MSRPLQHGEGTHILSRTMNSHLAFFLRTLLPALGSLLWAGTGFAATLAIQHLNVCEGGDALNLPDVVEELGFGPDQGGPFAADYSLDALELGFGDPVHPPSNNPFVPDRVVAIINNSGRSFGEVWYVADASTSLSNWDGTIDGPGGEIGLKAFRIDAVGENRPLLYESLIADGIWQDGEVWEFVIQDFVNLLVPDADAFGSLGLGSVPGAESSGSLVASVYGQTAQVAEIESRLEKGGVDVQNPVFSFQSGDGVPYIIQSSPDLSCWTDLQAVIGTGGEISYEDSRGLAARRQFYRVKTARIP